MNSFLNIIPFLGIASLVSCSFGPDYSEPQMDMPQVFRKSSNMAESIADLSWKRVIPNTDLQNLLSDTMKHNYDARTLLINIDTAGLQIRKSSAPLFPWLGYSGSATRADNSSGSMITDMPSGSVSSSGSAALTASWELDLWGKVRKGKEAAIASYHAEEEAYRAMILSLFKEVATGYLQLIKLDEQLSIAKQAVISYQDSQKMFVVKFDQGMGSRLQIESANAALVAAQADVADLSMQIQELETTLSALAGRMPGSIKRSASLDQYVNNNPIPAGIPAQILARRPDIRQKAYQLRQANSEIGVAIANYFPSVSLTGNGGFAGNELLSSSHSKFGWNFGANLTGPIFQGGQLSADKKIAENNYCQAVLGYEQTVTNAMSSITKVLIRRQELKNIITSQQVAVESYKNALKLAMTRYKNGLSNYYEVLTAQQNLFPAQTKLAQYKYQYVSCVPTLYAELGGGWKQ